MDEIFKIIFSWLSSFTQVYYESSIPTGAEFPYITYALNANDWKENSLLTVNLYTKSTSLKDVSTMANKILESVGEGLLLKNETGDFVAIYKGAPTFQIIPSTENNLKQGYMTFQVTIGKSF